MSVSKFNGSMLKLCTSDSATNVKSTDSPFLKLNVLGANTYSPVLPPGSPFTIVTCVPVPVAGDKPSAVFEAVAGAG